MCMLVYRLVCMLGCILVRKHASLYVSLYVNLYVSLYISLYVCMLVCMLASILVWMLVCVLPFDDLKLTWFKFLWIWSIWEFRFRNSSQLAGIFGKPAIPMMKVFSLDYRDETGNWCHDAISNKNLEIGLRWYKQ